MTRPDALALATELDECWHDQPRSFEREAVTRFWGLLTLPARALDPVRPRELLRSAVVLRNARFRGDPVRSMFFGNKDFTEVDALFLKVGSSLGHLHGDDAWVVEVERKDGRQQSDYYLAVQRARKFGEVLSQQFRVRARPVLIYEDDGGKYNYPDFDNDVLHIRMQTLRDRTRGLSFPSLSDLPGVAGDKTLVKMALVRKLVGGDPNHPGWYDGPLQLARAIGQDWPLHLPVVGHQDTSRLSDSLDTWLRHEREDDQHLADRIDRYLDELRTSGVLDPHRPMPRLSMDGGQIALRLLQAENEDPT